MRAAMMRGLLILVATVCVLALFGCRSNQRDRVKVWKLPCTTIPFDERPSEVLVVVNGPIEVGIPHEVWDRVRNPGDRGVDYYIPDRGRFRARTTTITRPYWVRTHVTTVGEWTEVTGLPRPVDAVCEGERCPLVGLSFIDVLRYANLVSERDGLEPCYDLTACGEFPEWPEYLPFWARICTEMPAPSLDCSGWRLPTGPEWEVASKAGQPGPFACSTDEVHDVLWGLDVLMRYSLDYGPFCPLTDVWTNIDRRGDSTLRRGYEYSELHALPVGSLCPNPWGIYDPSGNVHQHTWSFTADEPDDVPAPDGSVDFAPPPAGQPHLRGGSFTRVHVAATSDTHDQFAFLTTRDDVLVRAIGFRLVRTGTQADVEAYPELVRRPM